MRMVIMSGNWKSKPSKIPVENICERNLSISQRFDISKLDDCWAKSVMINFIIHMPNDKPNPNKSTLKGKSDKAVCAPFCGGRV
jgi:hypothetical protein